jgi:L-threonine kinase
MKVTVKAPGSCGELAQGTIGGKNFLITCPIDVYSEVTVTTDGYAPWRVGRKVFTAINKTLHHFKHSGSHLHVCVKSDLPLGKGMASSSADISATCQSVALSLGQELLPDEIADIALTIEPTDGIFYPGIMLFDHVHGQIRQYLGEALPMYIVIVDVGGEINTLHFNKRCDLKVLNKANESQVTQAMNLIIKGLNTQDIQLIGQGATISALANQSILFKPHLENIIAIGRSWGAVGVNIAHSGTVVGILFPLDTLHNHSACIEEVHRCCAGVRYLRTVRLISGGLTKK